MALYNLLRLDHQQRWRLLLTFLLCGLRFTSDARSGQPQAKEEEVPQATAQTLLSPEMLREDLDYAVKILRNVHPATYDGFSDEQQAVIDAACRRIQEPLTANAFYFIVNSVICSLRDGHTNLHPRGDGQNRRIDVPIIWLKDGFYVQEPREPFQQGNWFAVMVKDNGLGTIIGEPTGNAPSSYGDVPSFQLPNTGFSFSVSHKKWVRPNPDNDPEDALYPDIPVYTTIEDVVQGADPQMEKLKAIVKEGSG